MKAGKDRRSFLGLLGASGLGSAMAIVGHRASADEPKGNRPHDEPKGDRPRKGKGKTTYTGTSRTGNIEEALQHAIAAAMKAAGGADRQVTWTLKEVSGRQGGFAPVNELTVTIEATVT